jgi:hypothetical protein
MSHDDYEFGPHHPIHVGRHYIGGWSYGRKRKGSGSPPPKFGRPMQVACALIAIMVAADLVSGTWLNSAEIVSIVLGAIAIAVTARVLPRVRRSPSTAVLPASVAQQAITGDPGRLVLEQQLRETQAVLAEVLTAARLHREETR